MLEGKDYECIDKVLSSGFTYVDKSSRCIEDAKLMKVTTIYSELLSKLYSRGLKRITNFKAWTSWLKRRLEELKGALICLLEAHCECVMIQMKLHLVDYPWETLEQGGRLHFLDASLFEHFYVVLKEDIAEVL